MSNGVTPKCLADLFSADERKILCSSRRRSKLHPVGWLLSDRESADHWRSQIIANTDRAVWHVAQLNRAWLESLKPRLLDTRDFPAPISALAEIRAYGALGEAHFEVAPLPKGKSKTPDFIASIGGNHVAVEVTSKEIDPKMQQTIDDLHAEVQTQVAEAPRRVLVRHRAYEPYGKVDRSKPGDSLIANAISRLRRIEDDKEGQLQSSSEPPVLWLDFQAESWSLVVGEEQAFPVVAWNGGVKSGPIWYAHYGWKGAPIMDHRGDAYDRRTVEMAHEGKFRERSSLAAVIISCPRTTILLENPAAKKTVPDHFRRQCFWLPLFSFQASVADWTPGLAARIVDSQAQQIGLYAEGLIAAGILTREVAPQRGTIPELIKSKLSPAPRFGAPTRD